MIAVQSSTRTLFKMLFSNCCTDKWTKNVIFRKSYIVDISVLSFLLQIQHVRSAWEPIRRPIPTAPAHGPVRPGRIRRLRIRLLRRLHGHEHVRPAWTGGTFLVHRYGSTIENRTFTIYYCMTSYWSQTQTFCQALHLKAGKYNYIWKRIVLESIYYKTV